MKLKKCHINGFGMYKNKDFDFDDLTQFSSENGTGKSTLADFIKFMLYDLPKKDERLKYAPFDNGQFGGSLVLEFEGKEYRVEKNFDYKSITKDEEKIYINNTLTDIKSLGNYLFKVDLEGFVRTIFINGSDLSISTNSTINSKLNSLVSKTEDDFDLKDVLEDLKEVKKAYGTQAKTKSLLVAAKAELDEKNNERITLANLNDSLSSSYEELKIKEKELENVNKEISLKEKENEKALLYEKYKEKYDNIRKLKNDSLNIKNKYPKILDIESINSIKNDITQYKYLKTIIDKEDFNSPELLKLKDLFISNPINEEDISNIESKIKELEELKLELKNKNQVLIKDEDLKRFDGVDVKKEILEAKEELNKYNELNDRLIASKEVKIKKQFNPLFIPAILSGAILILGIVLLVIDQLIAGIVLMALGAIGSIAFLLLATKNKNQANDNSNLIYEYRKSEKRLIDILAPYRYDDSDFSAKLIHLENDYEKYINDISNNEKIEAEKIKTEERISYLKASIEEFINKYLDSFDEYREALRTISLRLDRYNRFIASKNEYEKNNTENKNKFEEIKNKLDSYCKEFNILFDSLEQFINNMKEDLNTLNYLNNTILRLENELNDFVKENNIDPSLSFERIDLSDLKNKSNELLNEFNRLSLKIKSYEDSLERLPYLESECNLLKEKIEEYKHKGKIYDSVINYLEAADNSLKEKYIAPLKEKFISYAKELKSIFKDNITFDKDFNLKLLREGKLVDDYHLSQGEKTIAMLCYRLALIDNMYVDKPFIILDDPFVNLDAKNLKMALDLTKKLSGKAQIIYFTCIDSRKL
ncbi:MAG: AAA family ATPase [Acholeplasmatales bacterium]|nr:AAA family ATPase [Acholeplasmatales bacterium]